MATPRAPGGRPGLFINRNYALLLLGQGISLVGDQVFNTTLVVWIAAVLTVRLSFSALAVSGVLVAASLPSLLIAPLAGVFVDRWDKRQTMILMDLLRALLVGALLPAAGVVRLPFVAGGVLPLGTRLGVIYAVVFLASICAQFFNPARFALIGDLVEEPLLARASGLAQGSFSLATIIGPPLAVPVLFAFGVQWALIIDALSFVVSFLTILAIRAPKAARSVKEGEHGHFWRELGDGLRFVLGSRVLITLVISVVLVFLGAGALNTLLVFFSTQNLGAPARLFGFIGAAEGIGTLVGVILATVFAQRLGVARVYSVSIVVGGILCIALARMTSFIPALAVILLFGVAEAAASVTYTPLLLHAVPRQLIGRVFSLVNPFLIVGALVGTALAGYLDSVVLRELHASVFGLSFGPVDTIYIGAGVAILLAGLYALVNLRGVVVGKESVESGRA